MTVQSLRFLYVARCTTAHCTANNSRKRDKGVLLAPNKRYGPAFVLPPPSHPQETDIRKTMGGNTIKRLGRRSFTASLAHSCQC